MDHLSQNPCRKRAAGVRDFYSGQQNYRSARGRGVGSLQTADLSSLRAFQFHPPRYQGHPTKEGGALILLMLERVTVPLDCEKGTLWLGGVKIFGVWEAPLASVTPAVFFAGRHT